jgi:hypothetical protein
VPHDVSLVEEHETDPLDAGEDLLRLPQARGIALRQVDLRDVPVTTAFDPKPMRVNIFI